MSAHRSVSAPREWVIADTVVEGSRRHVLIRDGRIEGFPETIEEHWPLIDARGGRLLPGLIDHHLHLFAAAAMLSSVDVSQCGPGEQERLETLLRSWAAKGRVRATGYDDEIAGPLDRWRLDALCPDVPVRVQYRTGSLWVLNSAALELALAGETQAPPFLERDPQGVLTGRVWRGDAWLRQKWAAAAPSLAPLGAMLSRWGVTAVTDASATTDQAQAAAIAAAAAGALPQRLMLMSAGPLVPPPDGAFCVGPVKLLLDECDLPP